MLTAEPKTPKPSPLAGKTKSTFFQPKLTVNNPNDEYEREADAVADRVMQMATLPKPFFKPAAPVVQKKCKACEEDEQLQRKETGNTETIAKGTEDYITSL